MLGAKYYLPGRILPACKDVPAGVVLRDGGPPPTGGRLPPRRTADRVLGQPRASELDATIVGPAVSTIHHWPRPEAVRESCLDVPLPPVRLGMRVAVRAGWVGAFGAVAVPAVTRYRVTDEHGRSGARPPGPVT